MELKEYLRGVELFNGLTEEELDQVCLISREKAVHSGASIMRQDERGDELFIITQGMVEVSLSSSLREKIVVNLGAGQIVGEMALVDGGSRSANVRAISDPTLLETIKRRDFDELCEKNTHLGYIVMRNLAVDLSFKLRHRNLSERGEDGGL